LTLSARSPNSFVRSDTFPFQRVVAPPLLRSEADTLDPSGVCMAGPPRVNCASWPRKYWFTLSDVDQKLRNVRFALPPSVWRTPRSLSKYQ
jgi:hypothetical protein